MCAEEDELIPIGPVVAKQLTDEVWALVNPGLDESQRGTDLDQEYRLITYIGDKFGCDTQIEGIYNANDLADTNFKHKVFALNLLPILNIDSNHFLKESPEGFYGGFVHVQDSESQIDGGNDVYSKDNILKGAYNIFGYGQKFGYKFNWVKR